MGCQLCFGVSHTHEPLHPASRFSGLARPVDPAHPTNKAVLILIPRHGLRGAAWALVVSAAASFVVSAAMALRPPPAPTSFRPGL